MSILPPGSDREVIIAQRVRMTLPPGAIIGNPTSQPGPARVMRTGAVAQALYAGGYVPTPGQLQPIFSAISNLSFTMGTIFNLAALDLVSFVSVASTGLATGAINANAQAPLSGALPAYGIVLTPSLGGQQNTVYPPGQFISGFSGLTIGPYFLSATAGKITTTPPTTAGSLLQQIGWAVSNSTLFFYPQPGVLL